MGWLSSLYALLDGWLIVAVDYAWGTPLLVLLVGGGLLPAAPTGAQPPEEAVEVGGGIVEEDLGEDIAVLLAPMIWPF